MFFKAKQRHGIVQQHVGVQHKQLGWACARCFLGRAVVVVRVSTVMTGAAIGAAGVGAGADLPSSAAGARLGASTCVALAVVVRALGALAASSASGFCVGRATLRAVATKALGARRSPGLVGAGGNGMDGGAPRCGKWKKWIRKSKKAALSQGGFL